LYDTDWNPGVDLQTKSRVFRMLGPNAPMKTVRVHRIVIRGTVDDGMLRQQGPKLEVFNRVFGTRPPGVDDDDDDAAEDVAKDVAASVGTRGWTLLDLLRPEAV